MNELTKKIFLSSMSLWLVAGWVLAAEQIDTAPAIVERPVLENEINRITLTPQAVARLGIQTTAVSRRMVTRIRILGGQLISPPGRNVTVSAPVAGIILPLGETPPMPGDTLEQGDSLFGLLPVDISGTGSAENLAAREAEFTAAENRVSRTRQLVERGGASPEELESAEAQLAQARAALILSRAQGDRSGMNTQELAETLQASMIIQSPDSGVLGDVFIARGQTVAAGAPLFQIQSASDLWVRLPIFAGIKEEMLTGREVTVTSLSSRERVQARPIQGAPSADPLTASIDLYFALAENQSAFREGERVLVEVPLSAETESVVIPYSAVFQDIQGGTWVYESLSPNVFARRRVQIAYISEDQAVITSGPAIGALVVSVGIAELAGTEFGVEH